MEDKRIVALFWERREQALELVREKYGKLCRRIAYNLLGNEQDVEECENDTYLAAWNAIPPARPDSLSAYLARITRNVALDRFDRRTAQKRGGETELLLSELLDVAAADTVEDAFDGAHVALLIARFLDGETAEYRWLFVRRSWYGDPLAVMAKASGVSENALKVRLHRQRERLRDHLKKEGVSL